MADIDHSAGLTPDAVFQALGVAKIPDSPELKARLLAAISHIAKGVSAKFEAGDADRTEASVTRILDTPKDETTGGFCCMLTFILSDSFVAILLD
jgi:hypothetical protein